MGERRIRKEKMLSVGTNHTLAMVDKIPYVATMNPLIVDLALPGRCIPKLLTM